ncbi:unnamed protein product [Anisakis simplex]|uniref:t-SNARE coiled-coil homology domain-containing protein n=1 Tax=Anisakis simplex TaxID=6269 RepID=A0A0M3JY24_ANISI|nr:unnamed protein product [Anisakis simplex]
MSVDREIDDIRLTIHEIHRELYKIDAHLDGAVEKVDRELNYFDDQLRNVVQEANQIRSQFEETISSFPNQQIYLAILLVLDVLIWLIVGYLIYKVMIAWKHRHRAAEKFMMKISGHPSKKIVVNPKNDPNYVVWKQPQPDNPPLYDALPTNGLLPMYSRINDKG